MKKWNKIKGLFLTIAASSAINLLVLAFLFIGIVFDLYSDWVYKLVSMVTAFNLLLMDANTHYVIEMPEVSNKEEEHD